MIDSEIAWQLQMGLARRGQGGRRKTMPCHLRRRPTKRSPATPVCPTGCAPEYEPRLSPVQTSTSDTFSSIYRRNNCHVISESII